MVKYQLSDDSNGHFSPYLILSLLLGSGYTSKLINVFNLWPTWGIRPIKFRWVTREQITGRVRPFNRPKMNILFSELHFQQLNLWKNHFFYTKNSNSALIVRFVPGILGSFNRWILFAHDSFTFQSAILLIIFQVQNETENVQVPHRSRVYLLFRFRHSRPRVLFFRLLFDFFFNFQFQKSCCQLNDTPWLNEQKKKKTILVNDQFISFD